MPQDQPGTNIGSTDLAQAPQPEPPTFGFSFSAMGASLADAAAPAADAPAATYAKSSARPAAPASADSGMTKPSHHWPLGVFDASIAAGTKPLMAHFCGLVITWMVDITVT